MVPPVIIAANLGVSTEEVLRMEQRLNAVDSPYELPDSDDGAQAAPAQYLADSSMDPALLLEAHNNTQHSGQALHTAIKALDPRSQHILQQRWLTEKKATLQAISQAQPSYTARRIISIQ